ncbi:MAG: phospholipid carrier-dependent glycosyltransferase [Clostridiales bacterium]|nr:phospholipid carrier-dependent glycosyltransferase [Clostridiales bacterium]
MKPCSFKVTEKTKKLAVVLLFLLLFGVGIATTGAYGQHCDENNQFVLVHANMKEYILQLVKGGMQADLVKWYDDRGIVEISKSENLDHGIAAYYPIAPLLLTDQMSHGFMLLLWNGYTFLLFFLGVISLYFIGKKLFLSRAAGCVTAVLFYLTPRMFAEGHYNNKDLILLCLALLSVWMGLEFAEKRQFRYAILMGAAAAFAANIKIVGAWPFALVGLWYLWELTRKKEWSQKNFFVGACAVVSFLTVYILITPACWSNPAGFLAYLTGNAQHFSRWDGEILFAGQLYKHSRNPLPRLYLIRMLGMTVPVYVLVLWCIGQVALFVKLCRERKAFFKEGRNSFFLLVSLWWFLPLSIAMASQTLVYNSWRHFYFCYGAIVLLAVYGLFALIRLAEAKVRCGREQNGKKAGAERSWHPAIVLGGYGVMAVCLLFTAVQNIKYHPYQYAYFNALAGKGIEEEYEIDYWVIGGRAILEELSSYLAKEAGIEPEAVFAGEGAPVTISACDITTLIGMENGWVNLPAAERAMLSCTDNWQEADYVVVNSTYSVIEELAGNADNRFVKDNYTKVCEISAYGNEIWSVYRK